MAKSKKYKAEKQHQREEDLNETEALDNQFQALMEGRLMAGLLRPKGQKGGASKGKGDDPERAAFDVMRRELIFDAKAKVCAHAVLGYLYSCIFAVWPMHGYVADCSCGHNRCHWMDKPLQSPTPTYHASYPSSHYHLQHHSPPTWLLTPYPPPSLRAASVAVHLRASVCFMEITQACIIVPHCAG